jgi:nucleoid-associated protein YgaU
MQNIERYGLVALVFLVVTVGAVLIWNQRAKDGRGSQGAKGELVADALEGDAARERVILHAEPTGRALREATETPATGTLDIGATGSAPLGPEAAPATEYAVPIGPTQAPLEAAPRIESMPTEPAPLAASEPDARPSAPEAKSYVVRRSDTLSEIAERELGTSKRWPEIVAMNPGLEPARLQAGVKIRLPARSGTGSGTASSAKALLAAPSSKQKSQTKPSASSTDKVARTYRVAKGDSLWKIAARTLGDGNRWREIAELNPRIDPDRLVEGQTLVLPGSGRSSEPLVAAASPSTRSAAPGAASRPTAAAASPRKASKVR